MKNPFKPGTSESATTLIKDQMAATWSGDAERVEAVSGRIDTWHDERAAAKQERRGTKD